MLAVERENLRGVTWVKTNEVECGDWAIGGQPLQAADLHNMAARYPKLPSPYPTGAACSMARVGVGSAGTESPTPV